MDFQIRLALQSGMVVTTQIVAKTHADAMRQIDKLVAEMLCANQGCEAQAA